MNHDPRDVMGIGQAHELPRLAGISGLEDAFAGIRRPRVRLISRAHPHDVRVGWRDGNGADGRDLDAVGNNVPGDAVVRRLPQPAAPRRGVDRVEVIARRRLGHGDVGDPGRGRKGPMLRNVRAFRTSSSALGCWARRVTSGAASEAASAAAVSVFFMTRILKHPSPGRLMGLSTPLIDGSSTLIQRWSGLGGSSYWAWRSDGPGLSLGRG